MTARNRLRKRLAQKAHSWPTPGLPSRNSRKNKESQVKYNASITNNVAGNSTVLDVVQQITITTPTLSTNPVNSSPKKNTPGMKTENCNNTTLASTAATIDPKNNQIQTVVVLPTREAELPPDRIILPSAEQGN